MKVVQTPDVTMVMPTARVRLPVGDQSVHVDIDEVAAFHDGWLRTGSEAFGTHIALRSGERLFVLCKADDVEAALADAEEKRKHQGFMYLRGAK